VGMIGTINKERHVNHMFLLIIIEVYAYNPKDSKPISMQRINYVSGMTCLI